MEVKRAAWKKSNSNPDLLALCYYPDGYECVTESYSDCKPTLTNGNTKTQIVKTREGVSIVYRDGKGWSETKSIIPEIQDIEVIEDRVIKVYFYDGTVEKAVLNKNDTYSFEYGVSICIIKKILSNSTNGNGSSVYNKLIDYALGVYKDNRECEKKTAELVKKTEEAVARRKEKERQRRIKLAEKRKEREIEIQSEAYLRAMRKYTEEQIAKFGMDSISTLEVTEDTPESAEEVKTEN